MAGKRIFIAVLDWGLGHASRCIPLVKALILADNEVIIGSNGRALQLLKAEFPSLKTIKLPTYNIRYVSSKMWLNLAWQWPKIIWAACSEYQKLQRILTEYQIDFVLSDSRFGCFSSQVPCIFITHQLHIRIAFSPLQQVVNHINHYIIRRFSECWIPDQEENGGLSGSLSHPPLNDNTHYLGLWSRMKHLERPLDVPLLAVLSGPEPQRTHLEKKIILQVTRLKQKIIIVQGKTELSATPVQGHLVTLIPFLTSAELNHLMARAALVICRSGYTSLMDLATLRKKALLIPTPGQTEQEYLAKQLLEKGICYAQDQKKLNLEKDLQEAVTYPGFSKKIADAHLLRLAIQRLGC